MKKTDAVSHSDHSVLEEGLSFGEYVTREELVQLHVEKAERYWKLAAEAKSEAVRETLESVARDCMLRIRGSLH